MAVETELREYWMAAKCDTLPRGKSIGRTLSEALCNDIATGVAG